MDPLYGIVSFNNHWIALEFDLDDQEIYVYDQLPMYIQNFQLKKLIQGVSLIFPDFIRQYGVCESNRHDKNFKLTKPWKMFQNVREKVPL